MIRNESREWLGLGEERKNVIREAQEKLPVALGKIAHDLGVSVKVATLEIGISGSIKRIAGYDNYEIQINRHETKSRQRFTLAHELSHFLLHKSLIGDGIVDTILYRSGLSQEMEYQANRLAADILMPRDSILRWLESNVDVSRQDAVVPLCGIFGVSEDAMLIRLGLL